MQKKRNYFLKSLFFIIVLFSYSQLLFAGVDYTYAIKWAREGKIQDSINELQRLYKKYPNNTNLLYDYITVLSWAEKDKDVLILSSKVDFSQAPQYLLQSVAKSARNLKRYTISAKLYIQGAKRFPNNPQFYLGLALVLNDMKRYKLAHRVLKRATEKFPENLDTKFTQAAIYEAQKNYFDAMVIYEKLLSNPKVKDKAVVKLVGTLRRQGMPWLAQKYIDQNPNLFNDETKYSIKGDQAAFELRWGTKGYHKDGDYRYIKDALIKIDEVIKKLQSEGVDLKKNKRLQNVWFDKMIALDTIGKRGEVINVFKYLKNNGVDIPYNILNIAADAYLYEKKPLIAREIIFESLRKKPDEFETKVLLFYSYSDNYDMHKAISLANKMDQEQLPKIWDKNHLYKIDNPKKVETALLKILAYEYSGYMDYSQKELESLVAKAPANSSYRNALAKLYYYRGWYDKAKEQFEIVLSTNPKDFDAKAGEILVAIKKKRYKYADNILKELSLKYNYKKTDLRHLKKTWNEEIKNGFSIQSSYGGNLENSSRGGVDDYEISADYYTSLINYKYRPYVFTKFARNSFYTHLLNNRRYGIGLKYENSKLTADTKLAYNETYISSLAPSLDLTWRADDRFSFSVGGAYFSDNTPLRALAYGIRADHYKAGIRYTASESSSTSIEYEKMEFTDKNSRDIINFMHYQRFIYGPYYNLDAYLYAGGMKNSLEESAVYYNPKEDYYISLEARNIWNIYTFYDFYIKQIFGLEAGTHWEKGYGANMTGALVFSQEWSLSEDFGFDLGYLRKRASYDGEIEYANKLFLNINGSF